VTLVAVTTRSKLRGLRFFPAMLVATLRARRQLGRARGIVRWASVIAGPTEFWTLTVWSGVHDLQEFMRSGAHGEVMWRMPRWLSEFWLARWRPGEAEVGAWDGLRLVSDEAPSRPPPAAGREEGAEFVLRELSRGGLTYDSSPLVRRSRARLAPLSGVVVRIDATPRSLVPALRAVRGLRRSLRRDPEVVRVFVGVARFHELYLFAVCRSRAAARAVVESARMEHARMRWGDRLWALEWRPENEFGHWDGLRMRRLVRFRRRVSGTGAHVDPRELFIQGLAEMLSVEETLAEEVLPKLREEVQEKHFREALDEHLAQTQMHAERLTEAFKKLKEKPQREQSPALAGLRRKHEATVREITDPTLRDLFCASSAAHTEHLEISSYHSLITLANLLGEPEIVHLLEENMHEEEEALEKVEKSLPERLVGQLAPV
jgi:ferritin-like metal-binding protein YciE